MRQPLDAAEALSTIQLFHRMLLVEVTHVEDVPTAVQPPPDSVDMHEQYRSRYSDGVNGESRAHAHLGSAPTEHQKSGSSGSRVPFAVQVPQAEDFSSCCKLTAVARSVIWHQLLRFAGRQGIAGSTLCPDTHFDGAGATVGAHRIGSCT